MTCTVKHWFESDTLSHRTISWMKWYYGRNRLPWSVGVWMKRLWHNVTGWIVCQCCRICKALGQASRQLCQSLSSSSCWQAMRLKLDRQLTTFIRRILQLEAPPGEPCSRNLATRAFLTDGHPVKRSLPPPGRVCSTPFPAWRLLLMSA